MRVFILCFFSLICTAMEGRFQSCHMISSRVCLKFKYRLSVNVLSCRTVVTNYCIIVYNDFLLETIWEGNNNMEIMIFYILDWWIISWIILVGFFISWIDQ